MGKQLGQVVEYCFDTNISIKWNTEVRGKDDSAKWDHMVTIDLVLRDEDRKEIEHRTIKDVFLGQSETRLNLVERFDLLASKKDLLMKAIVEAKKDFADYNYKLK